MGKNKETTPDNTEQMRDQAELMAEELSRQERLFSRIHKLPDSQQKQKLVEKHRAGRDDLLTQRCGVLENLCREYEKRIALLKKDNNRLKGENKELVYKLKCLRYELNKALGIKQPAGNCRPEAGKSAQADQKESSEKAGNGRGKRGAPKGHRGGTRPIPEHVDVERVFPPPEVCQCGCERVRPLDDFDARYIEDIPPVSKTVTREIYLRGRCEGCGRLLRHKEATCGPPVRIGTNLAVHLTLMNQAGMTFGKLSEFATRTLGIALTPSGVLGIVRRARRYAH